ncbi:DUF2723 domain-containing protein [bacterium]|nr:DUF2723 domain-containing protein [candidate division CSSED10-310 bacterium]
MADTVTFRRYQLVALVVFLLAFAGFLPGLCPTVYWLDSGEIQTALPTWGIPHSPSFPAYLLLSRPMVHLPFGDLAFRANLATAVAGALIAALVYLIALQVMGSTAPIAIAVAATTGIMAAVNPLMWFQNLKAEIYSLNLAFILMILSLSLSIMRHRHNRHRLFVRAALLVICIGLGLATHSLLTAHVVLPVAVLFLFILRRFSGRELSFLTLLLILILSIYVYLPVRSSVNPFLDTGNPETRMNFINAVTRRGTYNRFFGNMAGEWVKNSAVYLRIIMKELGLGVCLGAVAGGLLMLRRRSGPALLLGGAWAVNIGVTLMNRNFNANPDTGPAYLMLSTVVMMVSTGFLVYEFGVCVQRRTVLRWMAGAGVALMMLLPVAWFIQDVSGGGLSHDESAGRVGRSLLDCCDPDAVFFHGMYHNLPFVFNYLQSVERFRTDVVSVNRGEIVYWPGGLENLSQRHPGLTEPVYRSGFGEDVEYLAARSSRHSGRIPYERARQLLFNAVAWMAREQAKKGTVYWIPSEDDRLLYQSSLTAWGPMFRVDGPSESMKEPGDRRGNDEIRGSVDVRAMDELPIMIPEEEIARRNRIAENCGFQQTRGAVVLATFYDLQCITLSSRGEKGMAHRAFKNAQAADPLLAGNCEYDAVDAGLEVRR